MLRRHLLGLSLFLPGCAWLLGPPAPDAAGPASAEAGVDAAAYAPPPGLPDLRPVFGLDPNHWAPAFMPAFTQEAGRAEVIAALTDFEEVDASKGQVELVTLVPKKPGTPPAVRSMQLSFHDGKLYSATVKLSFAHRYDPAFQLYVVHLARLNYGAIEDGELESEETITIISDDGDVQLPNREGIELNLNFPKKPVSGRVPQPTPAPSYPPARQPDEADFAPPEGLPDLRPLLGIDRDHWAPAFMKAYRDGAPEPEVLAALTAFEVTVAPEEGDRGVAELKPKDPAAFPGLAKVSLTFRKRQGQTGRGLTGVELELDVAPSPELGAYVAKLGEHNFGGAEPAKVEEIMTWIGDHGAMAQTSMAEPPTISVDLPDY